MAQKMIKNTVNMAICTYFVKSVTEEIYIMKKFFEILYYEEIDWEYMLGEDNYDYTKGEKKAKNTLTLFQELFFFYFVSSEQAEHKM